MYESVTDMTNSWATARVDAETPPPPVCHPPLSDIHCYNVALTAAI